MRRIVSDNSDHRHDARPSTARALRCWRAVTVAVIAIAWFSAAHAQQPARGGPIAPPDMAESVLRILEAGYLTDEERKDLRIFHGVWRQDDLDTPARRARAALIQGAINDRSLHDPLAPAEDRAEGMMLRGELAEALSTLEAINTPRAIRIRAESLEALGRFAEAGAAIEPLATRLRSERFTSALDLVEGARALIIRARILGPEQAAGQDYHVIMGLLARARDELDRLCWPAHVAEAELLYEKDNPQQAQQAIVEALRLNPRAAAAWRLFGEMAVGAFDFERAESIAARLDVGAAIDAETEEGSPFARIILAKARLRQRDAASAEESVAHVLAKYPLMRPARAIEPAVAAAMFDFDRAELLLSEFDVISPDSPTALLETGRAMAEARQYEQAADFLRRAAVRQPNLAAPVIELGLVQLQSGHDAGALEALERAFALDPFNVRADNSLRLIRELITWSRIESEHFAVRFKPGIDELLAKEMLPILERIHARVAGSDPGGIDHTPAQPTLIELMPDHRWFAVRITGISQIHTIAAATGPIIAMESPQVGPGHSVGVYDWPRVIQHEYAHTVTLSRTNNRIPHWFTEAAAVYLEDAPWDYARCRLLHEAYTAGALFDMDEVSLRFVRPIRQTDRAQAYAQSAWMYQYIVERHGHRAPLDLMDLYAEGVNQDEAMRRTLGVGQAAFFREFKPWAKQKLIEWGMEPPEGTPTLRQLILRHAVELDVASLQDALDRHITGVAQRSVMNSRPVPFAPSLPQPDDAMIEAWLAEHPAHPELLELSVEAALRRAGGEPRAEMIPLLERYAAARPVDPMPHRHLARLYLGGAGDGPAAAIPHLEYLDAREQHSGAYAIELARRHAALEQWEMASARAERATQIAPFSAPYREFAATVALRRGDRDTALRHITALTLIEPHRELHQRRLEALKSQMGG